MSFQEQKKRFCFSLYAPNKRMRNTKRNISRKKRHNKKNEKETDEKKGKFNIHKTKQKTENGKGKEEREKEKFCLSKKRVECISQNVFIQFVSVKKPF